MEKQKEKKASFMALGRMIVPPSKFAIRHSQSSNSTKETEKEGETETETETEHTKHHYLFCNSE